MYKFSIITYKYLKLLIIANGQIQFQSKLDCKNLKYLPISILYKNLLLNFILFKA